MALAQQFAGEGVQVVIGPAMGAVQMAYEVSRHLQCENFFAERNDKGAMELRRGFAVTPGMKVLLVEDVVTTGLSSREAIAAVAREGGEVIAEAALVDRSNGSVDLGVPFHPLIAIAVPSYEEGDVPPELAAIPVTRPGSRKA